MSSSFLSTEFEDLQTRQAPKHHSCCCGYLWVDHRGTATATGKLEAEICQFNRLVGSHFLQLAQGVMGNTDNICTCAG